MKLALKALVGLYLFLILVGFLLLVGSISNVVLAAESKTAIIQNDLGGNVTSYLKMRDKLSRLDSVTIRGECFSACTIFTTLPNACVEPKAKIGFHGTSPKFPFIQKWLDMRIGNHFRGEVKKRYEEEWRFIRGNKFHTITGKRLHELDPLVKLCP